MLKRIVRAPTIWVALVLVAVTLVWHLPAVASNQIQQATTNIYLPVVISQLTLTPQVFIANFDMETTSPLPFADAEWDAAVHTRDRDTLYKLVPMQAQHGLDCSPPPTTHLVDDYEEAVFRCRNHIMTAIDDGSYAAITLTPATLLDFSQTEGIVRFDLSTARTSTRDWVEIWITPYELNLVQPLQEFFPDLNGPPRDAVLIELLPENSFVLTVFHDFQETSYKLDNNWWTGYQTFLEPSAMRRDTFELSLRRDHVRFCMPDYNFCWIDSGFTAPLTWSSGVVQLSHHSYTAAKACNYDGSCGPNTWHWDNVEVYPAIPFLMLSANRRYVEPGASQVSFSAPTTAGANLRFSAIGKNLEVSFNKGQTWQAARRQQQTANHEDHFSTYWMPVPAGVQTVTFRGDPWYGGDWHARNISIWGPAQ